MGGIAVAIGLLGWTFRQLDVLAVRDLLVEVGGPGLLLVLLPLGASLLAESLGWAGAFRALGRRAPLGGLLRVRVSSEALALTLPGGMLLCEAMKPLLLARHCGLSADVSLAGMALRKYLLVSTQAVYICLFCWLGAELLERASPGLLGVGGLSLWGLGLGVGVGSVALCTALSLRHGRVGERAWTSLQRLPLPGLRRWLEERRAGFSAVDDSLRAFFRGSLLGAPAPALGFFVGWCFEALETYLILRLLGVDLPFAGVAAMEVVLSLVRHVTFILPGGLGVQDLGYVAFLRALGVEDALVVGAAFIALERTKDCLWAALGYGLLAADLRGGRALGSRPDPASSAV